MRIVVSSLLATALLILALGLSSAQAHAIASSDVVVTELELTGGSLDVGGRFAGKLDRLFHQPGLLVMNEYQPGPDLVPPVTKPGHTFSLFTSGVQGQAAPSAMVVGNRITVDLSSLFFGVSKGDRLQAWNIGGLATGWLHPDTLEFCLTWDHLFGERHKPVTFSLQGLILDGGTTPVPLMTTAVLFGTGLALFLGVWRRTGVRKPLSAATA